MSLDPARQSIGTLLINQNTSINRSLEELDDLQYRLENSLDIERDDEDMVIGDIDDTDIKDSMMMLDELNLNETANITGFKDA